MNSLTVFLHKNHILALVENACHTKSRNLKLAHFDICEFPKKIIDCHELKRLYLQRNCLTDLPREMDALQSLKTIAIDYNKFSCFPKSLCDVRNLVEINISHNPIGELPAEINKLGKLEVLWCNDCDLSALPPELCQLELLDTLGLRSNHITQLPANISNLKTLRWLTMEDNKINSLPDNFSDLTHLIHLNLSRNCFEDIPLEVCSLVGLKYCSFRGNKITEISAEMLTKMCYIYKIDLQNNPIFNKDVITKFLNVSLYGGERMEGAQGIDDTREEEEEEEDEDWEGSLFSSEIDSSSSESDVEDDRLMSLLPKVSKYLTSH